MSQCSCGSCGTTLCGVEHPAACWPWAGEREAQGAHRPEVLNQYRVEEGFLIGKGEEREMFCYGSPGVGGFTEAHSCGLEAEICQESREHAAEHS